MMRWAATLLCTAVLLTVGLFAHGRLKPLVGPPRAVLRTARVDLGTVSTAATRGTVATFYLQNGGLSSLTVSELHSSCGCVDLTLDKSIIEPGERGRIRVKVATDIAGSRNATVTVFCNDPERPRIEFELLWTVVAPFAFAPSELNLGPLSPGARVERTVEMVRNGDSHFRAFAIESHESVHPAVVSELELRPQGPCILKVRVEAGQERGDFRGAVITRIVGAPSVEIVLPIQWSVHEDIEVFPQAVLLGSGAPGSRCTRRVVVSSFAGSLLGNVTCRLLPEGNGATFKSTRLDSRKQSIEISMALPDAPGNYAYTLEVSSVGPPQTVVSVPVMACVNAP